MVERADHVRTLIMKHMAGQLTAGETRQLEQWIDESQQNRDLFNQFEDPDRLREAVREYAQVIKTFKSLPNDALGLTDNNRNRRKYLYVAVFFAFLITLLGTIFYVNHFNYQPVVDNKAPVVKEVDVLPGTPKATLTLADNQAVNLEESRNGALFQQGQVLITKTLDGSLVYKAGNSTGNRAIHTLTTPKGGFYNISLADGTRVWLNAATSVRYPSIFHGTRRRVELSGEAYFEVANNILPLVVETSKATIEVTGTKFNCSAYNDENIITTLLEGSVRIIANNRNVATPVVTTVKAGQQVIMDKKTSLVDIKTVYAETSVAWKNGSFYFDHSDITEVMRQVARWYDVDIVYDPVGTGAGQLLTGQLERNVPLSNLLEQLERIASVKFEVKGKIITVRKP